MTPRSPQGYERRRAGEGSEESGRGVGAGGGNGAGEDKGQGEGVKVASVRVRVTGLDRTRRDFFVKFNAEVSSAWTAVSIIPRIQR